MAWRGRVPALVTTVLAGFALGGCGTKQKEHISSTVDPHDRDVEQCISRWNRQATPADHAALATAGQRTFDRAVLVAASGDDPSLRNLGRCFIVTVDREDKPNVAFVEDSAGAWTASHPVNPIGYTSNSPFDELVQDATDAPNSTVGGDGLLALSYPYSLNVNVRP